MTEESKIIFRGNKCAAVIAAMCELFGISLREATDIYYNSETAALIEDGVADLQCRSDKYLATIIWDEHKDDNLDRSSWGEFTYDK